MTAGQAPLAAVLLAHDTVDLRAVGAMVAAARAAGAQTVVVVLARGADAPADVRVARVAEGAARITALRAGMALLTNTTARLALVWPASAAHDANAARLDALVLAARRQGAAVTAFAGADPDASPVIVARDAWLEVVTLGEQGMGAVAARRGLTTI